MSASDEVSGQGARFDAALVHDFIKTTLSHNTVADLVYELLAEQVTCGLSLRPLIDEVLGTSTSKDRDLIGSGLLTHAKETLSAP